MSKDYAILAGGCFWCTEAIFENVDGVISVYPGYIGGKNENPSYEEVCRGNTGHAEAVKIEFELDKISYEKILDIFLKHMIQQHLTDKGMILVHNTEVLYFTVIRENMKLRPGKLMNCKMTTMVKSLPHWKKKQSFTLLKNIIMNIFLKTHTTHIVFQ